MSTPDNFFGGTTFVLHFSEAQPLTGPTGPKGDKGDTGDDGKSAYAQAVEGGFSGTEEEFMEELANVGAYADRAETAAYNAATSASDAASSAASAEVQVGLAEAQAGLAASQASIAEGHANQAESHASAASSSASDAAAQVALAEAQVGLAEAQVTLAAGHVASAQGWADNASSSASAASGSAAEAAQSAVEAEQAVQQVISKLGYVRTEVVYEPEDGYVNVTLPNNDYYFGALILSASSNVMGVYLFDRAPIESPDSPITIRPLIAMPGAEVSFGDDGIKVIWSSDHLRVSVVCSDTDGISITQEGDA